MNRMCVFVRALVVAVTLLGTASSAKDTSVRPNVILIMAHDLGYGDTGFNGNTLIDTQHMDRLAEQGVVLTHFYSGNSVCSPTRATCLTGRHHDRMGIWTANAGHLPNQEITLARILKEKGYATGHFGKWHLGTLSKTESSKGEKRKPALNFAPPWLRDYDASFVTESAVSTWDPGLGPRAIRNPFYENGVALDGEDESLRGGAAKVVVDRLVPFVEDAVEERKPFFAVCWFHAPHEDIAAGPEYLKRYEGHGDGAHYYGCITEMDEQIGRIVDTLEKTEQFENTIIFFCSDNGPEGKEAKGRRMGGTDGLRGRKRALHDGGVRVPAFAVWPGNIKPGTSNDSILTTLDYFPTIAEIVGYEMPDDRPIDGEDVLDILQGQREWRSKSIPFRFSSKNSSIIRGKYKLLLPDHELFDLSIDRAEQTNLAAMKPELVSDMKKELISFFESVEKSHSGKDYEGSSYKPVDKWRPLRTEPKVDK